MDQGKVGSFISELRKSKKMTQAELGDIVGVTGKAVSRWERGLNLPDRGIMNKVSEALGVTTTELLNGERVVELNTDNLDKITESSVEYYKAKLKQKFKKVLFKIFIVFIVVIFGLLAIFYYNNSGSCNVYKIDSASAELFAEGIITQTANNTNLVISNFRYIGTNIRNVYSIDYELILDDEVIDSGGYNSNEINYSKEEIDIKKFFKAITIYLDTSKNYNFDKQGPLVIKFKYADDKSEVYYFDLPLKIEKKFTNNKFFYFK